MPVRGCYPGVKWLVFVTLVCAAPFAAQAENAALASIFRNLAPGSKQTIDHAAWTALLGRYVHLGEDGLNRVDYAAFKRDGHGALKSYIGELEKLDPRTLDRPGQFAYLANLYNAKTIDVVLEAYPIASIKDISLGGGLLATLAGGPWKAKVVKVGGVEASLDDIEHGVLRPLFKDPRVHYAVNCASIGCPNLGTEAFTATKLDEQLDAAARAYVNHQRGAKVSGDGLIVSSIYKWYQGDFGGSDEGVVRHLRKYAAGDLAVSLETKQTIASHAYDWGLNDITR